jgi:hypothetical protein
MMAETALGNMYRNAAKIHEIVGNTERARLHNLVADKCDSDPVFAVNQGGDLRKQLKPMLDAFGRLDSDRAT